MLLTWVRGGEIQVTQTHKYPSTNPRNTYTQGEQIGEEEEEHANTGRGGGSLQAHIDTCHEHEHNTHTHLK